MIFFGGGGGGIINLKTPQFLIENYIGDQGGSTLHSPIPFLLPLLHTTPHAGDGDGA